MPEGEYRDHTPVLLEEVVALLDPGGSDRLLDLTVGPGGHSAALLARLGPAEALRSRIEATLLWRRDGANPPMAPTDLWPLKSSREDRGADGYKNPSVC